MKLLTFFDEEELRFGVKTNRGVLDIKKALEEEEGRWQVPGSIGLFIQGGPAAQEALSDLVMTMESEGDECLFFQEESLQLGPCVPEPGKIICVGLNYRKHAEESNMPVPEVPVLFNKFSSSVAAHGQYIALPADAFQFDYEAELAIVIGRKARNVAKEKALDYVIGYCNANDFSARDLQFRTSQWLLGKCSDGFCPLGPYLVTADETGDPNQLDIRSIVNGEVRQHSNTSDMVFYCDEIISYISRYMTLEPGDVVLTGTPEGVILGYPEEKRVWLNEGDEVTIEIEKLGSLTNRLVRGIHS